MPVQADSPRYPKVFRSFREKPGWVLLTCFLAFFQGERASAQPLGPIVRIPIEKVRETYLTYNEKGTGKSCGVRLYGEWTAYRNYTNRNSYIIFTPGLQSTANPQVSVEAGGRFRFYCYFNGISTPFLDSECPTEIGNTLPDWYVEVRRRGPTASFQYEAEPPGPGEFEFTSRSTDPEGELLVEEWDFGDGSGGAGVSPIHRYTKPGSFTVRLTVTDTDALTNSTTRTLIVPAPKLETSLRMPDNPPGITRVSLGENFKLRLRVGVTRDGVGALSNVRFTTNAVLNLPSWITVIEQPSSTELGTLQPGDPPREFDWVLRADDIGKFAILSSSLTALDAAGRTVTQAGAVLNGSVPGLTVEVVFPEDPVRLKRKAQEEDNNTLSENPGYERQGFPVILRVSVPEYGRPVRDVRLNNADANDGGLDIDRVKRTANADVPWVQAVPQPVPFPITVTNKASPAMFPGVLAPGARPVEFKLMVETDTPGDFSFTGIISGLREDGLGEVTEVGTDVLTIGGDVLLAVQVEMVHPLVLPRITEGEAVEIFGKLKNMTWDDTVEMHPVRVISQGQGIVLGPAPYDGDLPPVGIPGIFNPVLKPREESNFRARIKTEVIPGLDSNLLGRTNVLVDFAVGGILIKEDGTERELKPEDILVEWGKGRHRPGNGINLLRARVDPDPHDTQLLTAEQFFSIAAGNAMKNLALGGKDAFMVSIPQTLGSLLPAAWAILDTAGAGAVESYILAENAGRYLWAWMDWQTDVYLGLESETRRQQYQLIADELYFYYSDKFDSAQQVREIVDRGIEGYFTKVLDYKNRAYEASRYGYNEELADVVAEPFRTVGQVAVEEVLTAGAVSAFVAGTTRSRVLIDEALATKAARARRAEQEVAEATADFARHGDPRVVEATPGMRALPGGTKVTPAQAIAGWAVDQISDRNLRRMTDVKNGGMAIIVAIRSRADETIEWIKNTPLGIVVKPVTFKPKNVDADDIAFLGYRDGIGYGDARGVGAGDRGATALAEPHSRQKVLDRLDAANADARTRKQVLDRYNQRWKEWYGADWPDSNPAKSKVDELKRKTPVVEVVDGREIRKGTLEVPRRGTTPDSSINMDTAGPVVMDQRRFEMRRVIDPPDSADFPNGREYWECWLEDETRVVDPNTGEVLREGAMRRIAGDIDLVAVTDATGHALPVASEFTETVAQNLQHGINAQHPWSSSLLNPEMRREFLEAHLWNENPSLRGEPLLLYVNGEARVGWFNPSRAITAENPLDGFMWLDGGTGDVDDVVRFQRDLRGTIDSPADVSPASFTPMTSNVRGAMIHSDNARGTRLLARCAIRSVRSGGAVYRLGQAETLEKRAEDGSWQAADPASECSDGELVIVPETALQQDVEAGALELPIIEDLLGFNWREMFQFGDQIVIDPGSSSEEIRTVVDHGSLIVDRPLEHFHPMGTQILLHRRWQQQSEQMPPLPPPFRTQPLVWLRADTGLSLTNGTNVISWTDQSGNGVVFSAPTEATRPVWVADSTSGLPAVRFAAAATPRLQGDLGRTLTNATIFSLVRWLDDSNGDHFVYAFGTPGLSGTMMTLSRRAADQAYHYDGAAERVADNAIPGTGLWLFSQIYREGAADRHRLAVNLQNVLDTRTTTGRAYSAVASNIVLGSYVTGAGGLVGDVVEWLVYDRILSPQEQFEVEEYLRQRAGLKPFIEPGSLELTNSELVQYGSSNPNVTWTLEKGNHEVRQAGVGDPAITLSDIEGAGQVIRIRLRAGAGAGAVGVVFGYLGRGQFHLLDLRQTSSNHVDFGTTHAGTRLRTFHLPEGQEPSRADFWSGLDPARVTTWRTNDVPIIPDRDYDVILRLEAQQTVVEVKYSVTTLAAWTVPELKGVSGRFGYYADALPYSRFGEVQLRGADPVITDIETGSDGTWVLHWRNGKPPFVIESTTDLVSGDWYAVAPATPNFSQRISLSPNSAYFRMRSAGVVPKDEGDLSSPTFGNDGTPWLISRNGPTHIEAENFDLGAPAAAYHDVDTLNQGGSYREEDVDIQPTRDTGGGFNVGWIEPGEWLEYTIDVAEAGTYQFLFRTARAPAGSSTLRVLVNGADKTGNVTIPRTVGAQTWRTVTRTGVNLEAGIQKLRIEMVVGGFNFNWFEIAP